ncbi:MAG: TonB family protein [candidate division NC10 bacterium]|nr:TonB family protein [candidate division NC10 bacterium]MBI4413458.1 TonB family protein [candidate division NC10 bacterium]
MTLSREQSLNLSLSLLLHALVLAAAGGAPFWGALPVRPLPVIYNVNLVAMPQQAAPAAPAAPPARPTPAPAAPRAVAPPPPAPEEELTLPGRSRSRRESPPPTVEVRPPALRPTPPAPATAAPQAVVPTPFAAPAAPAAAAAANGTDVEATAGSGDPAAATYTAIVSERVRALWEPPGQGRVVVNARVLRSRFVRDVVVVRPSGNPLFDMSAVRAIQEAVKYPPFLPLMREEYVDIAFTFTGKEGRR